MATEFTTEKFEADMEQLSADSDLMRSTLSGKIASLQETERKIRARRSELLANVINEAPGAAEEYNLLEQQLEVTVVVIIRLEAARESLAQVSNI